MKENGNLINRVAKGGNETNSELKAGGARQAEI
jgi:hypothetical protein